MPFSKMDPSCTIGFYSRSIQDYERISQELTKVRNAVQTNIIPIHHYFISYFTNSIIII